MSSEEKMLSEGIQADEVSWTLGVSWATDEAKELSGNHRQYSFDLQHLGVPLKFLPELA